MKFVWAEPTRVTNLRTHRMDFADAEAADRDGALIQPSYGGRYLAILPYEGGLVAIAFARLGTEALSIISMRPASRRERRLHAQT